MGSRMKEKEAVSCLSSAGLFQKGSLFHRNVIIQSKIEGILQQINMLRTYHQKQLYIGYMLLIQTIFLSNK